jgi:hypothetical protein
MNRERRQRVRPDGLKTYSLLERKSKVKIGDFAREYRPGENLGSFIDSLPGGQRL